MWKFFIFWIVLYVIYVFYLTIRALIDPKFAEKLSEMNRRERKESEEKSWEISFPCNKWRLATMV